MSENNKNKPESITDFDKLVVDIKNNLTTRLTDLMSKLLNSAQDNLFDMSEEADNNEDQRRYFELMNQIRTGKADIASSFDDNIKAFLVPADEYKASKAQDTPDDDLDELSLVGQDEMEGIVLVKGIGERAAGKYREQLQHLEARLEHLALKTPTIFSQDALNPTNFCQAFNDALSDDFDNINRKTLFGMFDVEIANKLDALYDSINNRLIDADILPQIKLHTSKSRPSRPRPKPKLDTNANPDEAQQQDYAGDQGYEGGGYADGGGYAGGAQGGPAGPAGGQAGGQQNAPGGGYAGGPQGGPAGPAGGQAGGQQGAPGGGYMGGTQGGPAGSAGGQAGGSQNAPGGGAPGGNNISGFAMTAAPGGTYRNPGQGNPQGQPGEGDEAPAGQSAGGSPAGYGGGSGAGNVGGNQGSGQTQSDNPHTPEGASEYQHYTAGMPASQVGRVLGNFISGAPITPGSATTPTGEGGEYFPESTPQHFGHQEIIQALSQVQNLPQFEQPEGIRFDGEAIKQAVLSEIAKTSGGAVTKRINQIAEKTIDFIELIFDAIIDDEEISDTIKALLLRLQIPIIKASMSDQEFFIYDDHPARVLLDTIAEVGIGITDHKDEMYIQLDKIISNILGEYDLTTETFQNALDTLNSIVEEEEARAREIEQQEQQQLLRKHARATVLKALRATTTGKTLPEAVHPLILKRWPTLMFNHYIKNGKENNEWVNLVLTLRHIVDSVQPITSPEQLAKLTSEKEELFEQTENYLNISSNSKKDVKNIVQTYRDTLQEHIDDANFTEEEISVAEEIVSNAEPEEEAPIEEETSEKATIPANVMPGMWFHVYMGEDKAARRCKLSVIIVEDANLMFVNHKGELVIEKSFDEFNEEITNEKTKMIMGHSAFDHAFKTVIDRLN